MQQLEREINMIQPESTFWSERKMKSSQILHTANIRSHTITGNSSASKQVVKYSPPSQIENQLHSLQKVKKISYLTNLVYLHGTQQIK